MTERVMLNEYKYASNPMCAAMGLGFMVREYDDGNRKHQCPQCKQWYTPEHATKADSVKGTISREQWMTGTCSDACWDEMCPEG